MIVGWLGQARYEQAPVFPDRSKQINGRLIGKGLWL
jgi:hypothetical protein